MPMNSAFVRKDTIWAENLLRLFDKILQHGEEGRNLSATEMALSHH